MNAEVLMKGSAGDDAPPVLDELVIGDLETLRALTDRQRLQIMEAFARNGGSPRTVKEVARELGEQPTKLYYHVNMLEQHGLLVLAGSRLVSGIVEKSYMPAARTFRVDRELLSGASVGGDNTDEVADAISSVLESAMHGLRSALANGQLVPGDGRNLVSTGTVRLTRAQAEQVREILTQAVKFPEAADDQEATDYSLTVAFHPTAKPATEL